MAQSVKSRKRQSAAEQRPDQQDSAARQLGTPAGWRGVVLFIAGIAVGAGGLFGVQALRSRPTPPARPAIAAKPTPTSYYDLLAMSPDELAKVDIALMNLLCAKGLPGAENLDSADLAQEASEIDPRTTPKTERALHT